MYTSASACHARNQFWKSTGIAIPSIQSKQYKNINIPQTIQVILVFMLYKNFQNKLILYLNNIELNLKYPFKYLYDYYLAELIYFRKMSI